MHKIDVGFISIDPENADPFVIAWNVLLHGAFFIVTDCANPPYKSVVHEFVKFTSNLLALSGAFIFRKLEVLGGLFVVAFLGILQKTEYCPVRRAPTKRIVRFLCWGRFRSTLGLRFVNLFGNGLTVCSHCAQCKEKKHDAVNKILEAIVLRTARSGHGQPQYGSTIPMLDHAAHLFNSRAELRMKDEIRISSR